MTCAYRGVVPKGSVRLSSPPRVERSVTDKDLDLIHRSAKGYMSVAAEYTAAQGS